MFETDIDQISLDELYTLRLEIVNFLDPHAFMERAYCEGWGDYDRLRSEAVTDFAKLRSRIRGLAIEYGIHADFLREYSEVEARHGLKITA